MRITSLTNSLAITCVLAILPAIAQTPPPAPETPPAPAPPQAQPVTLADIPGHLNQSLLVIRRISQSADDPLILKIRRDVAELAAAKTGLVAMHDRYVRENRLASRAAFIRGMWTSFDRRIGSWQDTIIRTSNMLGGDLKTLDKESDALAEASRSLTEQKIQIELLSTVANVQRQIVQARQSARKQQNDLLRLQADLTETQIEVRRVETELADILETSRARLFDRNAPPIWSLQSAPPSEPPAAPPAASGDGSSAALFGAYVAERMLKFTGIYLLFLSPLLLFRKRLYAWIAASDEESRLLSVVVDRPYSFSVLPAQLFASILEGQVRLDAVLILLPMLRILPAIVRPAFRTGLWALAGLDLLDSAISSYLPAFWPSTRIIELLQLLLLGGTLLWLESRIRRIQDPNWASHLWKGGVRLCIGLTAVAIVAGTVGATALTRYLHSGVLRSVMGAVMLYGFGLVVQRFLRVVIQANPQPTAIPAHLWNPEGVAGKLETAIRGLVLASFFWLALESFQLSESFVQDVKDALVATISFGGISFTLGSLALIVGTMTAAALLSRAIRFGLEAGIYGRVTLQRGTGEVISKLVHYLLLTGAFLFSIGAAGIDLSRFTLLVGALGVGIGLGLQNIVSNFMSGLILLFERPLSVGDTVRVGDVTGIVTDVGIRATRIRVGDGADVAVPNSNLLSGQLTNWRGLNEPRGSELRLRIAQGAEPAKVIRLLEELASEHSLVLPSPPPTARFSGFAESSLDFVLTYWSRVRNTAIVSSELYTAISQRLEAEGIHLPVPSRELRLIGDSETLLKKR